MANSPLLNIVQVAPGQTNKEQTINDAVITVEQSLNRVVAIDASAGNVALTTQQFTRYQAFKVSGQLDDVQLTVPHNVGGGANTAQRIFTVINAGAFPITVTLGSGSTAVVPPNTGAAISSSGTNLDLIYSGSISGGIPDAPVDGSPYIRQDGGWIELPEGMEDAPSDGTAYVRQDGAWAEVPETGIEEAPADGKIYARKDNAWVEAPVGDGSGGGVVLPDPDALRYWRILIRSDVIRSGSTTSNMEFGEIQFRSAVGVPEQATGGTPYQLGNWSNVEKLFDNDPASNSFSTSVAPHVGKAVGYQFDTGKDVREVAIRPRPFSPQSAPQDFDIECSVDGVNWILRKEVRGYTAWTDSMNNFFPIEDSDGVGGIAITSPTGDHVLNPANKNTYIRMLSATACTLTVPTNADARLPVGSTISIRAAGAGQVTIVPAAGVTINTGETLKLRKKGSSATLIKVATNEWDLTGDLELAP